MKLAEKLLSRLRENSSTDAIDKWYDEELEKINKKYPKGGSSYEKAVDDLTTDWQIKLDKIAK